METAAVRLEGVAKQYVPPWQLWGGNRRLRTVQALDGVSLTIPQGEICGLLGVNGAGKTTLIKILAALILPDQGWVQIDGINLLQFPLQVKRRVGLVTTNDRSFYWRLSCRENLDFFASLHGLSGAKKRTRIAELLHLLAIEPQAEQQFMTLSTGQRQRLAIARALLSDPAMLLLDEPTTGLDPVAAAAFKAFVQDDLVGKQGKTVLWCTHNLHEAEQLCDRVVVLHQGRIAADLNRREMVAKISDQTTFKLVARARDSERLADLCLPSLAITTEGERCIATFRAGAATSSEILGRLATAGIEIFSYVRRDLSLEDLFPLFAEDPTVQ